MSSTKEKVVGLKQLSKDGNSNVFRRVQLAAEILEDREFVTSEWGDEFKAWESLEQECFSMLRGFLPLSRLLQIYKRFPTERHWVEYNYNLSVLDDLCAQAEAEERAAPGGESEPTVKERRRATVAQLQELESEKSDLEYRVVQLERENAELKSQLRILQKVLDRMPEPAAA